MPVTTPDVPTVAIPVLLLDHAPPGNTFVNVVLFPSHIYNVPVVAGGFGLTVINVTAVHPVGKV
jgi:hypothetical protein